MRIALLITLVCSCAGLAACGGSTASTANTKAPDATTADTARVRFAECMRKAGIDFPDPGQGGKASVSIPDSISPQRMDRIQKTCETSSGLAKAEPPPTSAEVRAAQDGAVRYTQCMRAHRIEIPDPAVASQGVAIEMGNVDTSSPRFKTAQKTCGKLIRR